MFSNPNIFWMSRATVQVLGSHTGSEGWNYLADCPSHSVNKGSCVKSFGNNRNGMKNNCKRSAVFSLEMGYFTVKPKRRLQWVQWSLGNLRMSGLTRLSGQSGKTPSQLPTDQKTPLWHFILPWQTTAMKNSPDTL